MNKYQRELKKHERRAPSFVTDEGTRYYGQVLNGKANGKGTQITKDGVIYKGHWINGHMSGKGIHYYTNGAYFIGSFTNKGHYHGKGAEYSADGKVLLHGIWDNGKFIGKRSNASKQSSTISINFYSLLTTIGIIACIVAILLNYSRINDAFSSFFDDVLGTDAIATPDNSDRSKEISGVLPFESEKQPELIEPQYATQIVGNWEVAILSCEITDKIWSSGITSFTPDDDNVFVVIRLTAKNIGKENNIFFSYYSSSSQAKIIYGEGYELTATKLWGWEEDIISESCNPLSTIKGAIVFSCAPEIANSEFIVRFIQSKKAVDFVLK
ncbi:MAG: DUF4352 domain-containing protein [Christensenellales bacterium]